MEEIDCYQKTYEELMYAKEHRRAMEEIVEDLKIELTPVKERSLLTHVMRLIIELDSRKTSSLYAHLRSPMKQALYLIDVYYSIGKQEEATVEMNDERWQRIAILLNEMEVNYFISIGFPNQGDLFHDERDDKIDVSLITFIGYFSNAKLCYEEQTLDRIVRYIKPYNEYIQTNCGFRIEEALKFLAHMRTLNNNKLNEIMTPYAETFSFYQSHPEEWSKLTQKFEERGVIDPHEWWFEPELKGMLKTLKTNPGEVHVQTLKELTNIDMTQDNVQHLIKFFSYDKNSLRNRTIYYAEKHHSETHPLIIIGEECICPINKFFLEGLYFRLDEILMQSPFSGKYKQQKDALLEEKVKEVFQDFFPKGTKIFTNYSVDGISENDLLIIFGTTCLVIEIKNCRFREPFRNPIKAYDRIKRDYGDAIQLGYKQCQRVENILLSNNDIAIYNAKDLSTLYQLKSKNICDVWKIVVTDFKYGAIQTDLSKLLEKESENLYPWSVCIDDLEVFLLLMRKTLKGIAPARFIEFLDYRERLQEHIICHDELEICGWYLSNRNQFKECADINTIINTTAEMGNIFDAYYHIGLGFKNEFDIAHKKLYHLPDYPKNFILTNLTTEMIKGKNTL